MADTTTAARRIAREVNATPADLRVAFDADGQVVDTHPAGMWYTDPADAPAYAVAYKGGAGITAAAVQFDLDAYAAVVASAHPVTHDLIDLVRRDWAMSDEIGTPRLDVDGVIAAARLADAEIAREAL